VKYIPQDSRTSKYVIIRYGKQVASRAMQGQKCGFNTHGKRGPGARAYNRGLKQSPQRHVEMQISAALCVL